VRSSNSGPPPSSKNGGEGSRPVEIILASWTDRFVAWLIDFILVSIGLGILFALLAFPFWFSNHSNDMASIQRPWTVSLSFVKHCFLYILDLL
jgi:hypothetical protein